MPTVNIHEAKTHLSRFVDQAAVGEEILIARAGKPVARRVALAPTKPKPRTLGLGQGPLYLARTLFQPARRCHSADVRIRETGSGCQYRPDTVSIYNKIVLIKQHGISVENLERFESGRAAKRGQNNVER